MPSDVVNDKLGLISHSPYKCTECNLNFNDGSNLRRHKRTCHLNEKPYKCDQCSKSFGRSDHLLRHKYSHRDEVDKHVCNINGCRKSFLSLEKLENHRILHTNKLSEDILIIKGFHIHKIANDKSIQLVCPIEDCKKAYYSYGGMVKHINFHNGTKKDGHRQDNGGRSSMPKFEGLKERRNYVCPFEDCKRIYAQKRNMRAHVKAVHKILEF